MNKIIMIFFFFFLVNSSYAEYFVLNNQAFNPRANQKSKIAIQWASASPEVMTSNKQVREGLKLSSKRLKFLNQKGNINLDIPKNAKYFRIVLWSKGGENADFITNWIDIVPNKTYTLNSDHLVPLALMAGTGC